MYWGSGLSETGGPPWRRARPTSKAASEKLNLLLGMRVGKWTVLTSNLDLAGLSKIGDRISSRIVREPGNLFIEMTTDDYGLRPKG